MIIRPVGSARGRLQLTDLKRVNQGVVAKISAATEDWRWCGRKVLVVDGSGLSMPDTPDNQRAWPQPKKAKPGFRTKTITVVTTLLDPEKCPAREIAARYRRRWRVELFLRDIKTTMGMDVLSCRTPAMVEKELWIYVIAYNLIRAVMAEAALSQRVNGERVSFKGAVSTVRQWASLLARPGLETRRLDLYQAMIYYIGRDLVPLRPDRLEPRAKKRRPKNYQLLNKPRAEFREIQHRRKYKKV